MPFDTSVPEPASLRRSHRHTATGTTDSPRAQNPATAAQPSAAPAPTEAPLTRREARARMAPPMEATASAIRTPEPEAATPAEVKRKPETPAPATASASQPVAPQGDAASTDAIGRTAVFDSSVPMDDAIRALGASASRPSVPTAPAGIPSIAAEDVAPRRTGRSFRRFAAVGASVGVMGVAGLLAVSMTLPSQAVAVAQGANAATSLVATGGGTAQTADSEDAQIQAFVAPTDVAGTTLNGAQGFAAMSQADIAAEAGINYSNSLYTNDTSAAIQWPYVVGVAMSSPYGMRDGVMHQGIDLIPGNGAPIQAIADGTVRLASESDGGYGVGVYIDHVIDGQVVTSHYGHMQYGSLRVSTGQKVKVGDIVGLTGDTGHSFGAHLHFEIMIGDSHIDPLPWMMEHAGRHSLDSADG